jgi:hypothetical protein
MISRRLEDSILDLLGDFAQNPQNPEHVPFDIDRIIRCHPGEAADAVLEAIVLLVSESSVEWCAYADGNPRGEWHAGVRITKSGLRFYPRPDLT